MSTSRVVALCAVVLASLTAIACGSEAEIGDPEPAPGPGFGGTGAGDAGAGPQGKPGPQSRTEFCASTGAGIVLPGTNDCTGDLASKTFRFAVCSCDSLIANGPIRTRSFDSTTKQTTSTGGALGSNGDIGGNGVADIGGAAWAAGRFSTNANAHVFQELRAGGGAVANGAFVVDRDYYGMIPLTGLPGSVKGASHVPASVAPPCNCNEQLPIDKIVAAFETANDNGASNIPTDRLAGGLDNIDLTLECGRYYFYQIAPNGKVTLRLKGRTAIFVGGDIKPNGGLDFVFEGGAELDLFVVGDLRLNGNAIFGDVESPARVRTYVKGANVGVNGDTKLAGNLYAPNAVVAINGDNTVRGAIYAKGLQQNGGIDIEYDEAILKVTGCNAGSGCASCNDCSGATPACKSGKCAACETNADCCAPLVCQGGACVPSVK
jgi:hypothetical protein